MEKKPRLSLSDLIDNSENVRRVLKNLSLEKETKISDLIAKIKNDMRKDKIEFGRELPFTVIGALLKLSKYDEAVHKIMVDKELAYFLGKKGYEIYTSKYSKPSKIGW